MSFSHDCFASVVLGVLLGNLIVYNTLTFVLIDVIMYVVYNMVDRSVVA